MEAYEELRYLGRGSYAVVKLVRRRLDGELLVIKKFHTPLSELSPKERNEIAQEIRLLAHLRHPNIIQFNHNFIEAGTVHIVMEYATGGTLSRRIADRVGELFSEESIWEILAQLVLALRYISSCHLLHRDLKTDNVLLSGPENRVVKLSDFGIAKVRIPGGLKLQRAAIEDIILNESRLQVVLCLAMLAQAEPSSLPRCRVHASSCLTDCRYWKALWARRASSGLHSI